MSKDEAQTLASLILENNCKKSFETGVANGISTLAITQAIAHPYWYGWPNSFRNLLVLQKVSNTDHPWNYYRNF